MLVPTCWGEWLFIPLAEYQLVMRGGGEAPYDIIGRREKENRKTSYDLAYTPLPE
jgi:hypothetical protein